MKRILGATAAITAAMAAAVFVVPDAALAAGNNSFSGTVNADGTWRKGSTLRHKTDTSAIKVNLQNNVSDGLCLEFRNASTGATIGNELCWLRGETGAHIIANSAGPQNFYIWFDQEDYTNGDRDRDFSGIAYY